MKDVSSSRLDRYWSAAYFPALDGLRAFCVLMVLCNHTRVSIPVRLPTYVGVDIFFVLSGFLITLLLLREREAYGNVTLYRLSPVLEQPQ